MGRENEAPSHFLLGILEYRLETALHTPSSMTCWSLFLEQIPPINNDLATNRSHTMSKKMMLYPNSEQNFYGHELHLNLQEGIHNKLYRIRTCSKPFMNA